MISPPPPPSPGTPSQSRSVVLQPVTACDAYEDVLENMEEAEGIYVTPGFGGEKSLWLGAVEANYDDAFQEKCCSVCSSGTFNGTAYSFHTEDGSPTICKAFSMRFLNDTSYGWYCTFSNSSRASEFDANGLAAAGSGVMSASFYTSSVFFSVENAVVVQRSPPPPSPAPPSPTPPPPDSRYACFGPVQENTLILSATLSYHDNDADAFTSCISAPSCYGVSFIESVDSSGYWYAKSGGPSVFTRHLVGSASYVYKGSCGRRLSEGPVSHAWRAVSELPDLEDHHHHIRGPGRYEPADDR